MRVVTLVWNQEPIMTALERGFQKAGLDVLHVDVGETTSHERLIETLKNFGPDIIFTHNSYVFDIRVAEGELLEKKLKTLGLPLVAWHWDSPWASGSYSMVRRFCEGPPPFADLAICVDEENARQLKSMGRASAVLPIGVDLNKFRPNRSPLPPHLAVEWLSFVGKANSQIEGPNPTRDGLMFNHCKGAFEDFCALARQTRMGLQLSPGLYRKDLLRVRDLFIEFFQMQCWTRSEMEVNRHRFLSDAERDLEFASLREVVIYLGRLEFLYSWYLLNDLLFVLKDEGLRVFGGDPWSEKYLGDFPTASPRLSDEELGHVFSRSPINLCHTKWQFRAAVHERPFLISACQGFALTDYRVGLRSCFTEDEVPSYENGEDLSEKIKFYKAHVEERERCAQRAYRRVVKDHSYDVRALELRDLFQQVISGKGES